MNERNETLRVIFSGGGTGGHIFPAVAIADKVKELVPDADIRFVGAQGRMEMERVPKAGYPIEGLWISGLQRKLTLENLLFPIKLLSSLWKARKIVKTVKPHVVVGTGGYASGPLLRQAAAQGIPTLIQEQNAYAGLTNKWLAGVVDRICVAYPNMERYFPLEKLVESGNPVREDLLSTGNLHEEACAHYGFDAKRPVIMVMGGSLGARTLNEAMAAAKDLLASRPEVQVLWQCGKLYINTYQDCATAQLSQIKITAFLDRMDLAYAAADVVISRAGALSIAEICLLAKASVLVPSPNVAEDHQTKNAEALTSQGAALLVKDAQAKTELLSTALALLADETKKEELAINARKMAYPDATQTIAAEVLRLAGWSLPEVPKEEPKLVLDAIKSIYFVGVGGIGMSAIARYFNIRGVRVAGYDRTETELTKNLVAEGIDVRYSEEVASLPQDIDLVVYTPAIPESHAELQWFRAMNYPVYKRSQVLGVISEGMRTVAVAGTHGKTTSSTLITHLLRSGGVDCNAFLGGVARNFSSNFVEGSSDWVVIEADEFDRSFLTLHPDIATIMSMDADHLDIYGDEQGMLETGFLAFAKKIKAGGLLLVRAGLKEHFSEVKKLKSFGIEEGDIQAQKLRVEDGYFVFDYVSDTHKIEGLQHPHPGRHNVENALASIAVALELGAAVEQIRTGLLSFLGIGRRFEFQIREADRAYIDDYAHHPTELNAAIGAARELYPGKKLTGIFQPHLFSRTQDFVEGFAAALDQLDEILLLDIYPAREEPIPGVTSQLILDHMKNDNCTLLSKAEVLTTLASRDTEVVLTLGAGDIDTLVEPIKKQLVAS